MAAELPEFSDNDKQLSLSHCGFAEQVRTHPTKGESAIEADRRTLRRDHDPDCTDSGYPETPVHE